MAEENRAPDKKIGEVAHAEEQAERTTGHKLPHGAAPQKRDEDRAGAKYTQEQPTEKGARKGRNQPPNGRESEDVRAQPGQDPVKEKVGEF
jgi:hypothetical protein